MIPDNAVDARSSETVSHLSAPPASLLQGGDPYLDFLRAKAVSAPRKGFDVSPAEVHPILKDHQRAIVRWMVALGCGACFAAFGLGKTVIELEAARIIRAHAGGLALIVLPLGVRQEFTRDAVMLGVRVKFIRRIEETVGEPDDTIFLTNYETVRDGKLDPRHFTVAMLDEASVLRGFGGTKTFREFMRLFDPVPYRFVATATPSPNEYIELLAYSAFVGVMDVGQAKAQPLDAKVLTPTGWRRMADIEPDSTIIAGPGDRTRVLGVYPQGEKPVFKVSFSDGSSTECSADHLWVTRTQLERNAERRWKARNPGGIRGYSTVRTTAQIAATLRYRGGWNHTVPLLKAVDFEPAPTPVDPWLLGFLLGDASLRENNIVVSTGDHELVERVTRSLPSGLVLRRTTVTGCDYSITSTGRKGGKGPGSNPLLGALRVMGLLGKRSWEKQLPPAYKVNSPNVLLAVLQGLMDADGTIHTDGTMQKFCSTSEALARDVQDLVRALGGVATIRLGKGSGRPFWLVTISLPPGLNPFTLGRKAERVTTRKRYPARRYIVGVEAVGVKPMQCIAVDHPTRTYVTDDYVVTHNTRFFRRNSEKADQLTLHPHKASEFWHWVASWALFVSKPSDLGFSDEGYDLPPLEVHWHEVDSVTAPDAMVEKSGQGLMFRKPAIGLVEAAREKRDSLPARLAKLMELRAQDPGAHRLIWHDLEAERAAIEAAIPNVVSVFGTEDLDVRERKIIAFSDGEVQELAAKPVLAGSGCNFQRHCAHAVFLGIGFKFNDFIQAIHRIQRFMQTRPVRLDLIYSSGERAVRAVLEEKWRQHVELVDKMTDIVREYGLAAAAMDKVLARALFDEARERVEVTGPGYRCVNNDCILELRRMAADSIDFCVTSIPFSTQYEYTPSYNDFGHTDSNEHFFQQMGFLLPELFRVMQPGRNVAIHVKDRVVPGGLTGLGFQTLYPFGDDVRIAMRAAGFAYLGKKVNLTDVVRENNQTYRLGWSEQLKDGTRMGCGVPEEVLLFRKPPSDRSNGYADRPVEKARPQFADRDGFPVPYSTSGEAIRPIPGTGYSRGRWQQDAHALMRTDGDRLLTAGEWTEHEDKAEVYRLWKRFNLASIYDFEHHIRVSENLDYHSKLPPTFMLLPPHSWHDDIWTDVAQMLSMNTLQAQANAEKHLCPLPFMIVDRLIEQFSMPGETVLDPFGGLMTVPFRALKKGRKGVGIELNPGYFLDGVKYCEAAAQEMAVPTLFDLTGDRAEGAAA